MYYAIIAAGEGSRLRNEGISTPKPLVRLGDKSLIDRLTGIFRSRPDCEAVSVIISPEVAACNPEIDADNVIVASTPGSMHSLARLAPTLKGCGRFLLTTVDTVFDPAEFDRYMATFGADCGTFDGCMGVTTYVDDEKPLYVSADAEGLVTGYFDTPVAGATYVSGGIYGLPESSLDIMDGCMQAGQTRMRDFQRALVASGMRLRAWPFSRIIDIDHASDIGKALALLDNQSSIPAPHTDQTPNLPASSPTNLNQWPTLK